MIVNRRPNLTHHRRRILTHPDLYDLLPFLCSGLSVVWSVREVGVGADSAETRVVGQEVTNEVALSATISGGPIYLDTPHSQFRCVIRQLLFPVSMMSQ